MANEKIKNLIEDESRRIPRYNYKYIFIGDRTMKGGNDYPLAKLMEVTENCKFHQVKDFRKTWWLLQRYELGLESDE